MIARRKSYQQIQKRLAMHRAERRKLIPCLGAPSEPLAPLLYQRLHCPCLRSVGCRSADKRVPWT